MQFTYYTEKSVAQSLTAINERLQARSGRDVDGWIDKNGEFCLSASTKVAGAFNRRTTLRGKVERVSGQTVITGSVSDGVPSEGRFLVFIALALVGVMFLSGRNTLLALAVLPVGLTLYVLMKGDHDNSGFLVREVQRSLSAKTSPIKKTDGATKTVRPVSAKSTTSKAKSAVAKPAAKKTTAKSASSKSASKPRSSATRSRT